MGARGLSKIATMVLFALVSQGYARAQTTVVPMPRIVIYPGDVIVDDMLGEAPLGDNMAGGPFAISRDEVVGKAAHRTLLPGKPIPLRGIDNPRRVRNGAEVKLIYVDGGLSIVTTGSALQDGGIGDTVKVRNADSGVTVSGQVQPDGAVRVNGG